MSTLKTHNLQSPDAGSVNIVMAPNAGMVVTGISTFNNKVLLGTDTEGLATYGENLTIGSAGHAGITLRTGTGHKGTVYFSDGTSGTAEYKGSIQYDHSDDSLRLAAGGSVRLFIRSGGEVAIGGVGYAGQPFSVQTSSTNLGYMQSTGTTRAVMNFVDANSTQNVGFGCIGNNHVFMKDGNEKVRIDSNGFLGIDNASPVSSFASARNLVIGTASGNHGMTIMSGTSNSGHIEFSDGTSSDAEKTAGGIRYYHDSDYMRFNTGGGTERLRITSDGKIGINENNPTLSFVMSSANQSHAMRVNNTNTNSSYTTLSLKNTQNDFQMWLQGPGGSSYAGTNGVAFYQGLTSGSYGPYVFYHGTTRRVSVDTDGDLTIVDGNLSVASGHGIDFSATSDGSGMTSELLDDYEEGYFQPSLDAPNQSGTGFTHFHNHGYYTKVGNIVNVTVYIQGYASSNASGGSNDDIKIIGLPFAPAVLPGSGSSNRHAANWTFGTTYKVEVDRLEGYTYGGNTYIDLLVPSNGGTGTMLKSNQINQNTCQFWCTATYRV